jgi:transcriptional regulator with PAS, ATPase and Fis domain
VPDDTLKTIMFAEKTMDWIDKLEGNIIVCDAAANVIYMNEKALNHYAKDGCPSLIGRSLFDCHNERSAEKIREIMTTHEKNVYTIEKNGRKKIIYQTPWMDNGEFKGIVELSLEIPAEMPHFVRG